MDNATLLAQLVRSKTGPVPLRSREARRQAAKSQLRKVARKIVRLETEGLRLYRALPLAETFHASTAKTRIGDGSNRSSKTMTGAVEGCRAWQGCDPHDKFVRHNGNALVVGRDEDQVAMLWRKCAEPGAFKKIRDEHTRKWRPVRPDASDPLHLDPYDLAYQETWRDAAPLIAPRMLAGRVAWDDRGKGIPRVVKFTTGWTVLFRSSGGRPPMGDHYHFVWFDEHLENEQFFYESRRGLVGLDESPQHTPKLIWTATAQAFNPQLQELREQAEGGAQHVDAFKFLIHDNPYVPDDEKQAFYESLSDDEREVRYHGKYAIVGRRIYPTYNSMGIHGCEPFEIPADWTRYVWVDPGRQHCGCLFFAVDPDEKHVYVYDGFDLRSATAQKWAAEVKKREREQSFEAFGIDQQMGRQTQGGITAANMAEQYYTALTEIGVHPRVQGPLRGFFPGSNDISAREESLLRWLTIRGDGPFSGTPKLQVMRGTVPELDKQFKQVHMDHRHVNKRAKVAEDVLVCLEYFAAFEPKYHEPELRAMVSKHPAYDALMRKLNRLRRSSGVELG